MVDAVLGLGPHGQPDDTTPEGARAVRSLPRLPRCSCGGAQTAAVVLDLPTALGLAENPGHLPGYGTVPADLARAMAADRDWVRWIVEPHTGHLLDRGARTYRPSDRLRGYIAARDQTCGFPGCSRAATTCDLDHIQPFGPPNTVAANLGPLCRQHHNAKTHGRWRLTHDPATRPDRPDAARSRRRWTRWPGPALRRGPRLGNVAKILITGMSGTGKSSALQVLGERGHRVVDTDYDGWSEYAALPDGSVEWMWREDAMQRLLTDHRDGALFVAGTSQNQGLFYPLLDHVVLLSASADVLLARIAARGNNPYGKNDQERALVLDHIDRVEPLLRASATLEIDATRPLRDVVDLLEALAWTPGPQPSEPPRRS